jgi:hypothetical protein
MEDMDDLNLLKFYKLINSILIPWSILLFFLVGTSAYSEVFYPENELIHPLIIGILSLAAALSVVYSQIINLDYNQVIIHFLRAHWRHAGQVPISRKHELRLAINSLSKGRVVFPNEQINLPSDYSQFVYPAKDFGKSS